MKKSGLKLVGIAILLLVIGGPLAKATDDMHGDTATYAIVASILLLFTGAALLLYGLYKVIAGVVKRA